MPTRSALLTAHWTLRIGTALCFIGHGAFGIITKKAWVPYFAVVGIPEKWAWRLMPAIGIADITLGLIALVAPLRVFLLYMTLWCAWTAMLRPLAGESSWEAIERAGNYGVPLALLVLAGAAGSFRAWFARACPADADVRSAARAATVLRLTTAMLLIGHGALASIVHKQVLARHLESLGAQSMGLNPGTLASAIGWLEILLGVAVAARPGRMLLLVAVAWKAFTELLYPLSGDYIWEFVERGGSYAAPLALFLLLPRRSGSRVASRSRDEAAG